MAGRSDRAVPACAQISAPRGGNRGVRRDRRRGRGVGRVPRASRSAGNPADAAGAPGCLDVRKVDVEVVTPGWRHLVFRPGRPVDTVDRNAYLFCVLEQFHYRLKHRDIFALASSRWADPRAQLLQGQAWEAGRAELLDSLQLPEQPDELFAGCETELDATWRYMAARAQAGDIRLDTHGRLHAAAVEAVAEPATLKDLRSRCQALIPHVDIVRLLGCGLWDDGGYGCEC